jgi:hypothetical protein
VNSSFANREPRDPLLLRTWPAKALSRRNAVSTDAVALSFLHLMSGLRAFTLQEQQAVPLCLKSPATRAQFQTPSR